MTIFDARTGKTSEARVISVPFAILSAVVSLAIVGGGGLIAWGKLSANASNQQKALDEEREDIRKQLAAIKSSIEIGNARQEAKLERFGEKLEDVRERVARIEGRK